MQPDPKVTFCLEEDLPLEETKMACKFNRQVLLEHKLEGNL